MVSLLTLVEERVGVGLRASFPPLEGVMSGTTVVRKERKRRFPLGTIISPEVRAGCLLG